MKECEAGLWGRGKRRHIVDQSLVAQVLCMFAGRILITRVITRHAVVTAGSDYCECRTQLADA